jgi:thiol:disulfide interchange protein
MISVYLLQKKLFQQTKQITNATQQINAQQSEGKASYSVFLLFQIIALNLTSCVIPLYSQPLKAPYI